MELKKLRCSNCDGALKQSDDGKYYCENCGTSYLLDRDPEDVFYEKFDQLTSDENMAKVAHSVSAGSRKVFLLAFSFVALIIVLVMIFISAVIRNEKLHQVEAERPRASVSSEIAERESEFYEDYDRVSQQIEEKKGNT
jgi:uncharacterized membrane protein YvbJ